jgi:TonB family protein
MTAGSPDHRARTLWLACARWVVVLLCAAAALQAQMAGQLGPSEAGNLERRLQANPEDLAARDRLVAYYNRTAAREPRLKHILWLIEHHPESDILGFSSAQISPGGDALNDDADYQRAREIWLRQIQRKGSNTLALGNAVKFFWQPGGDLGRAADLLKRLRQLEPKNDNWTQRLASLYAFTLLQSAAPPPDGADPALVERFKTELETSSDRGLVAYAGSLLTRTEPARPELAPVFEFGRHLLQRSGESGASPASPARAAGQASKGGVSGGAAAGGVPAGSVARPRLSQAKLLERVPPVYPPLAKQARIHGLVRLRATIGKDGRVGELRIVSGHPLLVPAALEAVKKWVYEPVLLDGEPVEALTEVDVNFTLGEEAVPPERIQVSGSAQSALLEEQVKVVYPPLAKQARVQGSVVLSVIIAEDGAVKQVQLVSGHPLLAPAAMDAVKKWVYRPTIVNGKRVEVITVVEVDFSLQE